MQDELLLQELRRVLRYDPRTGLVHWKISFPNLRIYSGDVAGSNLDGYTQLKYTDSTGVTHQWLTHRLAWWFMTGRRPAKGMDIGHNDGDRSNCRWNNLSEVTRTKNKLNLNDGLYSSNKSGYRGVWWMKDREKWRAELKIGGVFMHRSDHLDIADAIQARRRAEKQYLKSDGEY